jgi:hypothetical protein
MGAFLCPLQGSGNISSVSWSTGGFLADGDTLQLHTVFGIWAPSAVLNWGLIGFNLFDWRR